MKSSKVPHILILDDNSDIVEICAEALSEYYHVTKTNSPLEATDIMIAGQETIDLVICDYYMPGMNGIKFVKKLRSYKIQTPAILYSGKVIEDRSNVFVKILEKPFHINRLIEEVRKTLYSIKTEQKLNQELSYITTQLNAAINCLESILKNYKWDFKNLDPEKGKRAIVNPEIYNIFLSWYYLKELCNQVQSKN